ncbi:hypothetical protein PPTG_13035 [Phytophthora nicotianae INRA-310]|uniref:Uncharacterized protein n=2 Tax=Phytophthora nicotianae TaxID=4792 RepID=W2Q3F9_PHYN3|nr:hypothetical protein PPTG_13035 [Phytophthora nicotianae INRA-310]ETN07702.1 hypothetical protein PPTG_13035 [Phytophthora nicotianae INRA-310]
MPMDECNDHLLFLEQIAEDKYRVKARRVGFRYNNNYDEELQMLARIATHHACDLVGGQYTASKQADYTIESEKNFANDIHVDKFYIAKSIRGKLGV